MSRNCIDKIRNRPAALLKRLAAFGFLFFLAKGLVWLGIGTLAVIGIF